LQRKSKSNDITNHGSRSSTIVQYKTQFEVATD